MAYEKNDYLGIAKKQKDAFDLLLDKIAQLELRIAQLEKDVSDMNAS